MMKKFAVLVGRFLLSIVAFVVMVVKNPGASLAVATLTTGVWAYWATGGYPWLSAVFIYTAFAWVGLILLRWSYRNVLRD